MDRSDGSRSLVVRLWEHDGRPVARLLTARDGTVEPTARLSGRDEIVAWIERWIDGDDDPVTGS